MITLEHVTHRYGEHTVISDLSYAFPDKGIVALMGRSGLGKTTLLRLLCGLERPTSGRILSSNQSVAVSFQEPRLISWLDCEKNINFVLSKENQGSNIAKELLTAFELESYQNALPEALSGGMKQRLSLARALAANAEVLLLDEPFSALDESLKSRILPLIKSAGQNRLAVIVTHDYGEAEALGALILSLEGDPVNALTQK